MQAAAQLFGFFAIFSSLVIYQQNSKKKLLVWKAAQDVSWLTHYLLLACYSAAATSLLSACRAFIYYHGDKKFGKSRIWFPLFLALYALSAVLTWKGIYSIFPAVSSCLSTAAYRLENPRHTKMIAIIASLCMLVYNITFSHSLSVYVGVTFTITSASASLIMPYMKKNR